MDNKKRHNKIVLQRIFAFILTIAVIVAIAFGAVVGIRYLHSSGLLDRLRPAETEPVEDEPLDEPVSEEDDSWVAVDTEDITDDYADVDTSVLTEEPEETADTTANSDEEIEAIIDSLAMEEKVAQLFMVTPEAITGVDVVTRAGDTTKDALTLYPVGGLIYFSQNFEDPDQTQEMLANSSTFIKDACGIAPFLAVDEEGGTVSRIASNEAFGIENIGPMADIGAADNIDAAYAAGETIGAYLSELGFNLDLAPVADIITDPDNEVIGDRSFGSDPELVSKLAWQFASGLKSQHITACFKHFPGHGSTEGDTHTSAVSQSKSLDDLYGSDLIPFQNAIDNDADMIMAAHISCPNITGDDTPASLSYIMLTDILRNEMGFRGIVITDAFNMDAVTSKLPDPGEAAVTAINAGADIILMPDDFHEAYNAVLSAAFSGQIETERINDSLRRILWVKLGKNDL